MSPFHVGRFSIFGEGGGAIEKGVSVEAFAIGYGESAGRIESDPSDPSDRSDHKRSWQESSLWGFEYFTGFGSRTCEKMNPSDAASQ